MSNEFDSENKNGKDETSAGYLPDIHDIDVVPLDESEEHLSADDIVGSTEQDEKSAAPQFEDISSYSTPPEETAAGAETSFKNKFVAFWKNNNKRNLKRFFIILAALIVALAAAVLIYMYHMVRDVNTDPGIDFKNQDETIVEDNRDFEAMHDVTDANSLDELIYAWATNGGEKMENKNVVNVMLFGVDSTDGTSSDARSDTMMLVSLNKETKKITLVSFMRDSYTYMNINGDDRYSKINASFNWGGPATVVKTVEDDYKIVIDKYVCVDFASFPKIIDSLGGVTVDVQDYEARYIRRTSHFKNFPSGDNVTLKGDEALIFSRIRHSDSNGDISRTRRQRQVIMAMIDSAKTATNGQINLALNNVFPNLRTSFTKAQILRLATQALTQRWMDYDIEQILTPSEATCKSATVNGQFVWVVDYPLEARTIQLALYGESNVVLEENRDSALDMVTPKTNYSSTSSSSSSGQENTTSGTGSTETGSTAEESNTGESSTGEYSTSAGTTGESYPGNGATDIYTETTANTAETSPATAAGATTAHWWG